MLKKTFILHIYTFWSQHSHLLQPSNIKGRNSWFKCSLSAVYLLRPVESAILLFKCTWNLKTTRCQIHFNTRWPPVQYLHMNTTMANDYTTGTLVIYTYLSHQGTLGPSKDTCHPCYLVVLPCTRPVKFHANTIHKYSVLSELEPLHVENRNPPI